jgi:hypothetical protein
LELEKIQENSKYSFGSKHGYLQKESHKEAHQWLAHHLCQSFGMTIFRSKQNVPMCVTVIACGLVLSERLLGWSWIF